MANQKKVAEIQSIIELYNRGWSQRRIARELGVDRGTVQGYVQQAAAKPAISTPGDGTPNTGSTAALPAGTAAVPVPKPAISTPGTAGRQSLCREHATFIEAALEQGLQAQRIYQDLVVQKAFAGSYQSVKRFVRTLRAATPKRFARLESLPGEQAQVDFGAGPMVPGPDGKPHKSWIFRIVLSYSRKAYSEAVRRQDTESFLRCLENAFGCFGGVPQTLVIDNLRAAVAQADWYEPTLTPKMAEFARHYQVVILPTRPYHPHHKGKIESQIKYVKNNALAGRSYASLAALNESLRHWESQIADQRIHGTTRRQVGICFTQDEKPALQPLPALPFPCYQEGRRRVHRDSFVEVAKAYYEVPAEYLGREVWVRWDARLVRVFNDQREQVATHVRLSPGQFSADSRGRLNRIPQQADYYQQQARRLGPHCARWVESLLAERGLLALRVILGLLSLSRQHSAATLDSACAQAIAYGLRRLADVRRLADSPDRQQSLGLLDEHELIRPLREYGQFVQAQTQTAAAAQNTPAAATQPPSPEEIPT